MEFKYSYRFTESAERDLDEILRYVSITLDNPIAAQELGRRFFEKIDSVRVFPDLGSPVENEFLADKSVRKLIVDNYIIYYKAHHGEKIISVVRIVYGKRDLDEILSKV